MCILKIEPKGLADECGVVCERKNSRMISRFLA